MKIDPEFYEAQAFHPDLGEAGVPGRIVFTQFTFRFESETVTVEIPCPQLTVRLSADGDEGVMFESSAEPGWLFLTPGQEILEHRIFTGNSHLRRQLEAIFGRKASHRAVVVTVTFFAVALMVGLGASWGIDKLVRLSVNRISPASVQTFGDEQFGHLKELAKVSEDPKLIAELNGIYARLRLGLPDTNLVVAFHIVESEEPNAGSLPGHIVVTRGLFEVLTTADEMAGVLSHELGHITQKHAFRRVISEQGPARILNAAFRDSGGTLAAVARNSQLVLGRSFSREYEREADEEGWKYLVAAHINPRGFIDALQKLRDYAEPPGAKAGVLSTHPATQDRIDRLEKHWNALRDKSGFIDLTTTEAR